MKVKMYAKLCKICRSIKNIKTLYGNLPHSNIAEIRLWDSVHVELIISYSKSIRQQHPGGAIITTNVSSKDVLSNQTDRLTR